MGYLQCFRRFDVQRFVLLVSFRISSALYTCRSGGPTHLSRIRQTFELSSFGTETIWDNRTKAIFRIVPISDGYVRFDCRAVAFCTHNYSDREILDATFRCYMKIRRNRFYLKFFESKRVRLNYSVEMSHSNSLCMRSIWNSRSKLPRNSSKKREGEMQIKPLMMLLASAQIK